MSNKRFEPRDSVKGDVARTYRYMQVKYNVLLIGKSSKKLFESWEKK
ncbi:MAG: endonuclease I, partial [Bacteriovoracaceae bacterium]|nr:endonuclease I [Bacteriovoracaceae bacterium]